MNVVEMLQQAMSGRSTAQGAKVDLSAIAPVFKETLEGLGAAAQVKVIGELVADMLHRRPEASATPGLKDLTGALRDLYEVGAAREQKAEERARQNLSAQVEMERLHLDRDRGMAELVLTVLDRLQGQGSARPGEELAVTLLKMLVEQQQTYLRELRDEIRQLKERPPREEDSVLRRLGEQTLQSLLNRDPKKEFAEEEEFWKKRLSNNNITNLELFRIQKELELEERRWEREMRQKERQEQERLALLQSLLALPQALRPDSPAAPATASSVAAASEPTAPLARCSRCGHTFSADADTLRCPGCGVPLRRPEAEAEVAS